MWAAKETLMLCQELKKLGELPSFTPGERIARGFADLGVEEFLVLPGAQILSLFTGNKTTRNPEQDNHFFRIFNQEEALQLLLISGGSVSSCTFEDQRTWQIKVSHHERNASFSATQLVDCFLKATIWAKNLV